MKPFGSHFFEIWELDSQSSGCHYFEIWEPDSKSSGSHISNNENRMAGCSVLKFQKHENRMNWRGVLIRFTTWIFFLWVVGMLCYKYG